MRERILFKLYHWVNNRGKIPFWVRWFYPKAHWCPDMDFLLVIDNPYDCFCGLYPKEDDEEGP